MPYRGIRLLVALAAAVLVAGCAVRPVALPTPEPTPTDGCPAPGAASEAVSVSGELGAAPIIVASGPFAVDRVERSVLVEGTGEEVAPGDLVSVAFTLLNGTTGDRSPGTARVRVLVEEGATLPGLLDLLECATVGSRLVGVVPAEAAFGSVGQPDLAIGPDDDVVFVVDVLDVVALQAEGTAAELPAGFPALDLAFAADGRPRVGIPDAKAPKKLTWAPLIVGTGDEVGPDDEFLVQFQAVNWRTGEVFDETWGDAPRSLLSIVPGVDKAIAASTVGSRLVVIAPPSAGYGREGAPSFGVRPTDTVVFVVDILATTPPPA